MDIEFLELGSGRCPVHEFLMQLNEKVHKKIQRTLELIESHQEGTVINSGVLKKMKGYEKFNLYEIRISYQRIKYRILCCIKKSTLYLVHIFKKTTQKTPLKEINTAISRIQTFLTFTS
jgi:phage-related protein